MNQQEAQQQRKNAVFAALADLGVTSVTAHFNGFECDGDIMRVQATPTHDLNSTTVILTADEEESAPMTMTLHDAIEQLSRDALRKTLPEWDENNGSHGTITINIKKERITINANTRYLRTKKTTHEC